MPLSLARKRDVAQHRFPVLWLCGPAGVGKSDVSWRLYTELANAGVALLTGPTGVGKSTIGFRFYLQCLSTGFTVGYVDLRQIGVPAGGRRGRPGRSPAEGS